MRKSLTTYFVASSPSPSVKVTESTTDTNLKPAMEADATSGKKKLWKTLYTMNFCENMHLDIFKKWKDISKISLRV